MISDAAVPQGGLISPVLSNIYLHYALDLWIEKVVKRETKGFVELIRYCDDFVILIQYKEEAKLVEMNNWLRNIRNVVEIKEWWKVLKAKPRGPY